MPDFNEHHNLWLGDAYTYLLNGALELLSRFSSYCTENQERTLLEAVIELFSNDYLEHRRAESLLDHLWTHLSAEVKASYFSKLIHIEPRGMATDNYRNALYITSGIEHTISGALRFRNVLISEEFINHLLKREETNEIIQKMNFEKLIELYDFGKMTKQQEQRFCELLWSNISQKTGLPNLPDRYMSAFLELPKPEDISVKEKIREVLLGDQWLASDKGNASYVMGLDYRPLNEIRFFCDYYENQGLYCWSEEEGRLLIRRIGEYWDNKKCFFEQRAPYDDIRTEENQCREVVQLAVMSVIGATDTDNKLLLFLCNSREILQPFFTVDLWTEEGVFEPDWVVDQISTALVGERSFFIVNLQVAYLLIRRHLLPEYAEEKLVQKLCDLSVCGDDKSMKETIIILYNLIYLRELRISASIEAALRRILLFIADKYDYVSIEDDTVMKGRILLRESCARLAAGLIRFYDSLCPEKWAEIAIWKDICEGNDFNIVRKAFKDC